MLVAAAAAWRGERGPRPRRALRVHLDVETGLGRAGLPVDRLVPAVRLVASTPGARLVGIWSHLQQADDRPRTDRQAARFAAALGGLAEAWRRVPPRHLANSAGLLGRAVPPYDGVRIGLATYGIVPDDVAPAAAAVAPAGALRPILSLHARPVRVADLPAGTGISYGPTFTTARPSRIATLPLGYGDGFPRALEPGRGARARAPRAARRERRDGRGDGRRHRRPRPPVTIDEEFVLLGSQGGTAISIEELARLRTTNTWEAVTAMSRRLPRVYHAAAVPVAIRTLTPWRER